MALRSVSYSHLRDEDLLQPIAKGSSQAFDELYRRYGQKLFSFFYRMLWKNKALAEDCVQELFIKLIKGADGFDESRSLSTWLYSIANNMCKNEYRKAEVRSKHAAATPKGHPAAPAANPDLQRFTQAVHNCLNDLGEDKRSLFVLRFQEGLTVPEISQVLSLPEGTVKSRLFYLLKEMKEALHHFQTLPIYP